MRVIGIISALIFRTMCQEKLIHRRWVNPYIPKLLNRPDNILHETKQGFHKEALDTLQKKIDRFPEVQVEIGSGSGMHLLQLASQNPTHLFIGFELRFKRAYRTIEKAEREGLSNIHIVRGDARKIQLLLKPESVAHVYIHFPDPWSKKKWRDNRLVTPEYLEVIGTLLKPKGTLSFRSDHQEYFKETHSTLESGKLFIVDTITTDLWGQTPGENIVSSEFELMFRSQNKPISWLTARRSDSEGENGGHKKSFDVKSLARYNEN